MKHVIYLGDYAYSSWSLRSWLLFEKFGLKRDVRLVDFHAAEVSEQLAHIAPARTVPTWVTPEGVAVSDSLAIAEELATRNPDAGLWPSDPGARAMARALAAEMHSGFGALREHCPMNLRQAYASSPDRDDVNRDLRRIEEIWAHARTRYGDGGPWLVGEYSVADAFFAPVAARIAGYALSVSDDASAYVRSHLDDPAFRRWRAMGLARGETLPWYKRDFPPADWPGPQPEKAVASQRRDAVNETCPYSGDVVTDFLEFRGQVYGFCNPFCRDKTIADPFAWPQFVALVTGR